MVKKELMDALYCIKSELEGKFALLQEQYKAVNDLLNMYEPQYKAQLAASEENRIKNEWSRKRKEWDVPKEYSHRLTWLEKAAFIMYRSDNHPLSIKEMWDKLADIDPSINRHKVSSSFSSVISSCYHIVRVPSKASKTGSSYRLREPREYNNPFYKLPPYMKVAS